MSLNKQVQATWVKYLCLVWIFVACLWNIEELNIIHVLNDEYGYWATGAFFAGLDWGDVTANSNYYSYGYGLILSIFMRIFHEPETMYKAAVVFNTACLAGAYLLTVFCAKRIFKEIKAQWLYLLSLILTFYSANIIQTQIIWPESLLYLLFWLIFTLIILFCEKPTAWKIVGIALCVWYMYIVHQRSLSVVLAVCIILAVMAAAKRCPKRFIFLFALLFICLLMVHYHIKQVVIRDLFHGSLMVSTNDFSGQAGKLVGIFTTLDGFSKALFGFLGKLFYVGAASLGMAFIGIYYLVKQCFGCLRHIKREHSWDNRCFMYVFLLLALLFALGINTVFMVYGSRLDCVIYGRYTEYAIGPFLLYGAYGLYEGRLKIKELVAVYAAVLICGCAAGLWMHGMETTAFNVISNIGLTLFYQDGQSGARSTLNLTIFLGIFLCVCLLIYYLSAKRQKRWYNVLILGGVMLFWLMTITPMHVLIEATQANKYTIKQMADVIEQYSEANSPIYYITDKDAWDSREIQYLQFLMPDAQIYYNSEACDSEGWKIYNDDNIFDLPKGERLVHQWGTLELTVCAESLLANKLTDDNYAFLGDGGKYSLLHSGKLSAQNREITEADLWLSNGQSGYLAYGPYMELEAGEYALSVQLKICSGTDEGAAGAGVSQGILDVCSNGNIFSSVPIVFKNGRASMEIPFTLEEKTGNMEFRIYLHEGQRIEIVEMDLIKL